VILADAIVDALSMPAGSDLRKHVEHMELGQTSRRLLDLYRRVTA
jgi:hypothetical protein